MLYSGFGTPVGEPRGLGTQPVSGSQDWFISILRFTRPFEGILLSLGHVLLSLGPVFLSLGPVFLSLVPVFLDLGPVLLNLGPVSLPRLYTRPRV